MPHTTRKNKAVPPAFKPAAFVNIHLTDDVKQQIKAADWTSDSFDNAVIDVTGDGYKLTLRYDERNDCFAAWLVAPDHSENRGAILAGRGSTPMKAVKQLFYIHFKLLERRWVDDHGLKPDVIDD